MKIEIPASARMVTFDVFDTVITRVVAEPRGVFVLLAQRLAQQEILAGHPAVQDRFPEVRMAAERAARHQSTHEEITLQEIYREMARCTGISAETCSKIAAEEVALERASARPVPAMVGLLEACRSAGQRIAFLSDMYLPASVLEKMLVTAGIFRPEDHLYVSSELRLSKRTGSLFSYFLEKEDLPETAVFHVGDNPGSDYAVPRRLGIAAGLWSAGGPSRYEKCPAAGDPDPATLLVAGAGRLARLEREGFPQPMHPLFRIGANLAGPVLTGYVAWVLREAAAKGIRRLYFVSRDGQVLLAIARGLMTMSNLAPIELRYLYGSRQAWHLPATVDLSSDLLDWLTQEDPVLTLCILAGRIGCDPELVVSVLAREGFSPRGAEATLSGQQIDQLRGIISSGGAFAALILSSAQRTRVQALAYFRQEGLFDEPLWAMVDMGWNGRLQNSLRSILHCGSYDRPVDGFYFGLFTRGTDTNRKHPYFFGPDLPAIFTEWGAALISILEVLTAADHGMVTGFQSAADGSVGPVFKGRCEHLQDWGLGQLRDGIGEFVRRVDADQLSRTDSPAFLQYLCNLLINIQIDPSLEEAESLGDYPFSSNQAETVLRPFAPSLSFCEAVRYLRIYDSHRRFQLTFWLHGSRKRSAWQVNLFLNCCSRLLRGVNRLFQALGIGKGGAAT
jgi:predicted HAD superfamily hydrolase